MSARGVTVVVVAYRRADLLEAALAELGGRFATVVVDNSGDPAVARVATAFGAEYRNPGYNGGFGAGVNVALRELRLRPPSDILLLNPDAVIGAAAVEALAAALHHLGGESLGMVSPSLVDARGHRQRVLWPFPSPGRAWLEAIGLGWLNRAPDFAVGTVLMLRWEAVRDVGLFDERFFLYAEETDWQRRARDFGWRATELVEVRAVHAGGATSADPARREDLFHAGTETYLRKWSGATGWQVYRAAVLVGACLRSGVPRAGTRAAARGRLALYRHGPRRAAGLDAR